MRASHLRSDLSRVLIVIEAGTWIYGRSSSSVRALRVSINLEAHRHCARYVCSGTCRVGPSGKGASHNSSSRARRFGRHYGWCSSAIRDPGIRLAANACRHVYRLRSDRACGTLPSRAAHAVGRSPVRSPFDRSLGVAPGCWRSSACTWVHAANAPSNRQAPRF